MPIVPRRLFLASCALGCGTSLLPRLADAFAPSDFEIAAGELIKPATQAAIDRGLAWLAGRQNAMDGSFGNAGYSRNAGVSGLIGLAFLSAGSTPDRGPYGHHLSQLTRFLLKNAAENGLINTPGAISHGPMYDHGFATLFLSEIYGMSPESELREKLVKAIQRIVESQNKEGGWRYQPDRTEADISVTICQIMALRAARNAGIFVPSETVDACIEYVKRCQNPDGGFMYMLNGGPSLFPRSAAGVVALYSAGIYEGTELDKGLEYLMQHVPRDDAFSRESHYFYGQYYAAQAMWQAGGDYWKKWYPAVHDALLARQRDDGAWSDSIANEYATAMSCIILQMPNNYLPIFQR